MKLFQKSQPKQSDPRELLRNVPMDQQLIWANTKAVGGVIREKETVFIFCTSNLHMIGAFDPENYKNQIGAMFAEVHTDIARDLVVGKSLVETLEASEAYQKAAAILEPILAAIAEKD